MTIELVTAEDLSDETDNIEDENEIKKRFEYVINYFQKNNPTPTTELKYRNPYELLVATILSARTTDKRVNMVTPALFEKYPTPDKLAQATPEEIFQYISSVSFPNNKSEYLANMAKMLISKYNGKIPEDENELQTLPGVGRKTANVIVATLFNKPTIAVDTHVFRVSERIGLTTNAETPIEAEEQLVRYTPKDVMSKMSHWLVLHGRYICTAKNPKHENCGIRDVCRCYRNFIRKR